MTFSPTIAIDGPAASGKSTVGCELAKRLGYLYFDTGVMYRAVTWLALQRNLEITDEVAITRLAQHVSIEVRPPTVSDGRQYTVLADNADITWDIRRPEVDVNVSTVSAYAGVRAALTAQQRRIGEQGRVVMVGRDIGTVVLPEADLKIYLTATPGERARRRMSDLEARGETLSYSAILRDMQRRDDIDSKRSVAPLRPASDAIILDTTLRAVQQVVDDILDNFRHSEHLPSCAEMKNGYSSHEFCCP